MNVRTIPRTASHGSLLILLLPAVLLGAIAGCGPRVAASGGGPSRTESLKQARDILPDSLRDDLPNVRGLAIEAYRDLDMAAPEADLDVIIRRGLPPVRFAALLARSEQARPGDIPMLREVFATETEPAVRLGAVYGLARLGDTHYLQMLADGLGDRQSAVRANSALILGLLGNRSAVPMLAYRLSDPSPVVRLNVAEAMWRLGDRGGVHVVRHLARTESTERSWWQIYAIQLLGKIGWPGHDVTLLREFEQKDRPVSLAAKMAAYGARIQLGDFSQAALLADMASSDDLADMLTDEDRAFALQQLARAAYAPAWREVATCLDHRDPLVRTSAAWAMLSFETPRARAVLEGIQSGDMPQRLSEGEVLRRPSRAAEVAPQPGGAGGPLDPRLPGNQRGGGAGPIMVPR